MQEPKLIIGKVVELKSQLTTMRIYLANDNTIEQVKEMLSNGDRLIRIFNKGGEIEWESKCLKE